MKHPFISKFKHRIVLLRNIRRDQLADEDWQEALTTFAEILPLYDNKIGSIEKFDFGQLLTENYYLFKVRFDQNIDEHLRISFKNRIFEIKRVINPCEASQILKIIALEIKG